MDDEQIAALAREYAEEVFKLDEANPEISICLLNEIKQEAAADLEEIIRFLLRRYCLVEKEAIRKEYEMIKKIGGQVTLVDAKTFNEGRISEIESIFPEIAKEVE